MTRMFTVACPSLAACIAASVAVVAQSPQIDLIPALRRVRNVWMKKLDQYRVNWQSVSGR